MRYIKFVRLLVCYIMTHEKYKELLDKQLLQCKPVLDTPIAIYSYIHSMCTHMPYTTGKKVEAAVKN